MPHLLKRHRKKLLLLVFLVFVVFGWLFWNRPQKDDMAGFVPADALAFIEADDLDAIAGGIQESEAWRALAGPLGAPSALLPHRRLIQLARWTGIAVTSIKEDEQQKLLRIEAELHKRVISQDKAITALARAIRRSRAGLKAPGRPVGCFLFLGPTGVGKTEVARRLAEFLFGSEKSLIRFDMSEYMEKHSVSKLIGAPPGYVGYEEGGQLTERVRRTPYSVILLDEIEKAHPDVYNILLQVFEDGQLTDGLGNTVDFRNTILIMTSNLGARHLQKRSAMGFQSASEEGNAKSLDELVLGEVKRVFNPEFLNRLDEIILFNPLGDEDLLRIIDLLVGQINDTLIHRQVQIVFTPEARQWVLDKTCGDRSYGARPLRRALQKYVEDPLSEALIQGGLQRPATLEVYVTSDGLGFRPVVEATPVSH